MHPWVGHAQDAFFRLPFWALRKVTKPKRGNLINFQKRVSPKISEIFEMAYKTPLRRELPYSKRPNNAIIELKNTDLIHF